MLLRVGTHEEIHQQKTLRRLTRELNILEEERMSLSDYFQNKYSMEDILCIYKAFLGP